MHIEEEQLLIKPVRAGGEPYSTVSIDQYFCGIRFHQTPCVGGIKPSYSSLFTQDSLWLTLNETVYQKSADMSASTDSPGNDAPKEETEVTVVRITDPTIIRDTVDVLDQDVISLSTEGFEVKRVTVPLDGCCLMYQWTNARLRTRTQIQPPFDVCTVLGPNARGSLDGVELSPHAMMMGGPGAQAEIIVDRDYESVALLVPPNKLREHLTLRGQTGDISIPESPEVWHPDEDIARENFQLGVQIANEAEANPAAFNDIYSVRKGAQVEFIDSLMATIESCNEDVHVDTDKKGRSYSQIVRTCEDFTLNLDERRPYVSELCAVAHVSERTLQYAFREIMGMAPLTYLHRLRLHRARDELRKADSNATTVTDVAMKWGFWHFGEFSRAYKNCFDEVPSRTLKQTPGE